MGEKGAHTWHTFFSTTALFSNIHSPKHPHTLDTHTNTSTDKTKLTYDCSVARDVRALEFVLLDPSGPECFTSNKVNITVPVAPSAQLPKIKATAVSAVDDVCPEATGELKFKVEALEASPALTQTLTGVLSPMPEGAECSPPVDGVFTCTKLAAQAYTFNASYTDGGCPVFTDPIASAEVKPIPAPVLTATAPEAVKVCTADGAVAPKMTATVGNTGGAYDSLKLAVGAPSQCNITGAVVACEGLPAGSHTVTVLAKYGGAEGCAAVELPIAFTVDAIAAPGLSIKSDAPAAEVCTNDVAPSMAAIISVTGAYDSMTITPSKCTYDGATGAVTCPNMPAGANIVKVSLAYASCKAVELELKFQVDAKVCSTYGCVARGPGYWMTHSNDVQKVIAAADGAALKLWGVTFRAADVTYADPLSAAAKLAKAKAVAVKGRAAAKAVPLEAVAKMCKDSATADALRALCVTSAKCELAKLGRQCMAALINKAVSSKAGDWAACSASIVYGGQNAEQWLTECCGAERPAALSPDVKRCMPALELINADADNGDATNALYPNGKPATSSKACNDYIQQHQKPTFGCQKGFCSTATTYFSRRLMSEAGEAPFFA